MTHRLARRGPKQTIEDYVDYIVRLLNDATALAINHGGTGADNAVDARANLGITLTGVTAFTATGDGATVAFNLGVTLTAAYRVLWFEDGIPQRPTTDFTVAGTTVTRTTAPEAGAVIHGLVFSA